MSVGVFDSGLGGLSVVREMRRLDPSVDIHYLADRMRAPYGPRPLTEVRRFAEEITAHLVGQGAPMVVIACNAASAAALHHLRTIHPDIRFVGMEPAVKPAALETRSGIIGVLTTAATFQGELFASVVARFAGDVEVKTAVCAEWVELVEGGTTSGPLVEEAVRHRVEPLMRAGADTLVLGCTHFPFLVDAIGEVAGPHVRLVDPGPAVARYAIATARELGLSGGAGSFRFDVTGNPAGVGDLASRLAGFEASPTAVTLTAG